MDSVPWPSFKSMCISQWSEGFFFFKPHEGVCGALITVVRAQCHGLGPVLDCVAFGEAYKLVMFCGDSGF